MEFGAFEMMPKQTQTLLSVKNLSAKIANPSRSVFAIENVSFNIKAGETLALVGESGSGKTMTALALLGLLPKQAQQIGGEIRFLDRIVTPKDPQSYERLRGKQIAMIFQEPGVALNPVFRVGSQITDVIKTHLNLPSKTAKERAIEILNHVGLPNPELLYRAYPHHLSGGMAQRVMIAMALSCNPKLIIADEPTTALDVITQMQILELIKKLQKQHQFSLLLISHDIGIVTALANSIIVMRAGKIIERVKNIRTLTHPQHPYTRALVNSVFHLPTEAVENARPKGISKNYQSL